MKIWVFAEKSAALAALCAGAHSLAEQVEAIVIGTPESGLSADKIWSIPEQENAMLEDYTETIIALCRREIPDLLLVSPTKRTRLMSGRIAAALGVSVIPDAITLEPDGTAERMVYGGAAIQREKATGAMAIVLAGPEILAAPEQMPAGKAEVETVPFVEPQNRIKRIGQDRKQAASVDLPSAKRVVGVGRGIAKAEDLNMVEALARTVEAEMGCTRPIAEEEKWMPRETYIGVSGLMIAPEVYIAIGASGQVQHLVGIDRAKTVIAINKDKNAPIFEHADYGIVGDLYKIVPALTEGLNAEKQK